MRARPRRGVLGLRGRIVGLVLFTTAATLAVAALTLLGPLESKLRNSARGTLEHDVRTECLEDIAEFNVRLRTVVAGTLQRRR